MAVIPVWQSIGELSLHYRQWCLRDCCGKALVLFEYPDGMCSVHTGRYQATLWLEEGQLITVYNMDKDANDASASMVFTLEEAQILQHALRENLYTLSLPYLAVARLMLACSIRQDVLTEQPPQHCTGAEHVLLMNCASYENEENPSLSRQRR